MTTVQILARIISGLEMYRDSAHRSAASMRKKGAASGAEIMDHIADETSDLMIQLRGNNIQIVDKRANDTASRSKS